MEIVSNEFLTDIAKTYSKDIAGVLFYKIPLEKRAKAIAFKDKNKTVILIDREKCLCSIQVLHALYHEIAHVICNHLDGLSKLTFNERAIREREAELWAARELKMLDAGGGVDSTALRCLPCCQYGYVYCANENGHSQSGA